MTDLLDIIIDNPKCNTCGIPKYLINYPSLINKNEIQLSNIQLISNHIHTKYIDDINNTKLLITIIQNLESKLQENITESLDDQKFKDAVTSSYERSCDFFIISSGTPCSLAYFSKSVFGKALTVNKYGK